MVPSVSIEQNKAGGDRASLMREDSSDDIDPYLPDGLDSLEDQDTTTTPAVSCGSRDAESVDTSAASGSTTPSERVSAAPEVHEHFSVDDIGPRSLLEMLEELSSKDDELPVLTPYVEETVASSMGLGERTVASSMDLDETTVASTAVDLGETTVASTAVDLGETTVASTAAGGLGETTVASTIGDLGETTVASTIADLGETTVASTAAGGLGETTVASTTGDLGETIVASTTGDLGETTVASSTHLGETVAPVSSAAVTGDTEAARAKARQLQLKALLAASAKKLSELSLFSICAFVCVDPCQSMHPKPPIGNHSEEEGQCHESR